MHQHTQNAIKMSAPRQLIRLLGKQSRSDVKVTNFACSEKNVLERSTIKSSLLFRDQRQSIEQHSKGPVTLALYDNSGGELKIRLLLLVMFLLNFVPGDIFSKTANISVTYPMSGGMKQRCSLS
jgi:hypothetical protein